MILASFCPALQFFFLAFVVFPVFYEASEHLGMQHYVRVNRSIPCRPRVTKGQKPHELLPQE